MNNITITGPRSVGKTTISKMLAKELKLKRISSDEIGEKALKKVGGLDKAIKNGTIKEFIRKKGYPSIIKQYINKNFIFDLSVGSFTSGEFKKASREVRSIAKKKSFVLGLLPFKNKKDSIDLLHKREIKRKHFKNTDKKKLLERTKKRYFEQSNILKENCDLIIYVQNNKPKKIINEISKKIPFNMAQIRQAKPADAKRISYLRRQTLERINLKDYGRAAINHLKKKNSPAQIIKKMKTRKIFVIANKNKILGSIEINLETGRVGGLYIDYEHLKQGLGLELMQFIENFARTKKIKKIILHPTKTALPFYKKLGYKLVNQNFWEGPGFKVKSMDMEKKLK